MKMFASAILGVIMLGPSAFGYEACGTIEKVGNHRMELRPKNGASQVQLLVVVSATGFAPYVINFAQTSKATGRQFCADVFDLYPANIGGEMRAVVALSGDVVLK